jgi:hypothetical protein
MPRPKGSTYDPQAIAWAVNEVSKGRSYRDVSEELAELKVKASHQTVKRWCAEAAAPKEPTPLATRVKAQRERAEQPPEPPVDDGTPFDLEATLQRLMRQAEAEAKSMDQASNARGAQAAARRATEMAKVLAVLDKRKPQDPDVMTYTHTDIAAGVEKIGAVVATLLAHGVRCCDCQRVLSAKWGHGTD